MGSLLVGAALWALAMPPQEAFDRQRVDEARRRHAAGEELMAREAFEEAGREFREATRLDPDFFLAHYSLGQAQMALKRFPEAIEAYSGAREAILRQSSLEGHARVESERRRRDEINEIEESVQRLRSGHIKGVQGFGQELALEERLRVLKAADMRGVEGRPGVPAELSLALGSAHYRLGQLEDAEREYRAAITVDPKHGGAHNNLAVVCMMTGRFDEARVEMQRAEQAGFTVSPAFKRDLQQRMSAVKQ